MCGFTVISLPSNERGRVNVAEIRKVLGADTAVCMMTNPNTLGLFEDQIAEIAAAVHDAGGLMYYDGANANAIMGYARPGDMGFDLMHLNTHKTFTIPHGGGGAGHGPLGVAAHLVAYSPDTRRCTRRRPPSLSISIVRSRSAPCVPFGRLRAHGARVDIYLRQRRRGVTRVSQRAFSTLTMCAQRSRSFSTLRTRRTAATSSLLPPNLKREHGVRALDIAKGYSTRDTSRRRYSPLLVPEC